MAPFSPGGYRRGGGGGGGLLINEEGGGGGGVLLAMRRTKSFGEWWLWGGTNPDWWGSKRGLGCSQGAGRLSRSDGGAEDERLRGYSEVFTWRCPKRRVAGASCSTRC